jgi:hypothetical protein
MIDGAEILIVPLTSHFEDVNAHKIVVGVKGNCSIQQDLIASGIKHC